MDKELLLKLKSNEFSAMYELVADILLKVSGNLDKAQDFEKLFSPYLLCRYLSMKTELIEYAKVLSAINSNSKLDKSKFYKLAYALVPKQRSSFIKYIKKKEKKAKEKESEINRSSIKTETNLFDL